MHLARWACSAPALSFDKRGLSHSTAHRVGMLTHSCSLSLSHTRLRGRGMLLHSSVDALLSSRPVVLREGASAPQRPSGTGFSTHTSLAQLLSRWVPPFQRSAAGRHACLAAVWQACQPRCDPKAHSRPPHFQGSGRGSHPMHVVVGHCRCAARGCGACRSLCATR